MTRVIDAGFCCAKPETSLPFKPEDCAPIRLPALTHHNVTTQGTACQSQLSEIRQLRGQETWADLNETCDGCGALVRALQDNGWCSRIAGDVGVDPQPLSSQSIAA
eukprot:3397446-Amphidinium_carterae.1